MKVFKKQETVLQNMTYMALMAAINVIFVLLTFFVPFLIFLLLFILPLCSAIISYYCKKRYFPIYFVVTLLLCFVASIGFNIFDTFIYVLPSLVTGFIFGLFIEKQVPAIYTLIAATVVQYGLTLLTFFVLGKIVANINLTESIIVAFGLGDFEYKTVFIQVFLFLIAQIQTVISYIFVKYQVSRLGIEISLQCQKPFIIYITLLVFSGLTILSYFYFPIYTIVLLLVSLPIYIYLLATLIIKRRIWIWISIGAVHLLFIFLFAFLYQYVVAPNQFVLILILFGLLTIIDFLDNYCFKQNTNNIK